MHNLQFLLILLEIRFVNREYMKKNNPLRGGGIGLNPSAYSLIVIRCRISYVTNIFLFFDLTKK